MWVIRRTKMNEIEKVKEIKKALEFQRDSLAYLKDNVVEYVSCKDILTYINELETLCNKTYEDLTKEIDRLEKENEIKTETITDLLKRQEFYEKEKLKQFAERLKEKCEYNRKQYCCEATVSFNDIDETLKDFMGEKFDNEVEE